MVTVTRSFALLMMLGLAACGGAAEPEDGAEDPTASASEALRARHPVEITEADSGRTIVTAEGRPLEVALVSNVTTGFDWQVASVDHALGTPSITHVPGAGVGAPGLTKITWPAAACAALGEHAVELQYRRAWETGVPPEKVFRFVVDVRAAGRALVLKEADDGARLDVLAGTIAEVALPSNPSTGYDWVVASTTPALPAPAITFTPGANRPGAPGVTHLRWATLRRGAPLLGEYAIDLAYERPWETGTPPQKTFTFRLTVSPKR